jgi:hypothetical protein
MCFKKVYVSEGNSNVFFKSDIKTTLQNCKSNVFTYFVVEHYLLNLYLSINLI